MRAYGGIILLGMCNAHKMATRTSGNAGRALFDSLVSLFVAKDQARLVLESIGINYSLQSNQFVGRPV